MKTVERQVRIFLSSPGDVAEERARAQRVAERLGGLIDGVEIEIFRWEVGRYYSAHTDFQSQIAPPDSFDLVVGIFWSRVGSPLPEGFPTMEGGRPYPSGTAFEVLRAMEHRRGEGAGRPDVLVYRKTAPVPLPVGDAGAREACAAALGALDDFMAEWFADPVAGFRAAFLPFEDPAGFEALFEENLRAWLVQNRRVGPERAWRIEERGSPFRGLLPFEAEHRDAFFGRRADIERARERLKDAAAEGCGFLLIEGASGSGKSSLARAGLLPRLSDITQGLRRAICAPGTTPLDALAAALFDALPELSEGDFPGSFAGEREILR
ncbi:ATP-binding protein [Palleronia rufa]|uniref:ATP-binding protein n=1 Tax=Palleronia rufa TaxID=1530186 RepID=UPI000568B996|nr:ATP-binding protein [Palleronia rufa]